MHGSIEKGGTAMIKFIKPLPISEETLGAYLEGNLSAEDSRGLEELLDSNAIFKDFVEEVAVTDGSMNESIYDEYPNFDEEFDLPEILDWDTCLSDNAEFFCHEEVDYNSVSDDDTTVMMKAWSDNILETSVGDEDENVAAHTDATTSNIGNKNYGYEPNYELDNFDPNVYQGHDNTCAIRCQQIILRDYGIWLSKEDLVEYATKKGWFDPDPERGGTGKYAVGNLLDDCGIETTRVDDATIYDIIAELRAGHRVIVNVDANELWVKNEPNLLKRLWGETTNRINDTIQNARGIEGANHALIVAGVNVNPEDPSDVHVTLIDSGTGEVCVEYEFKDFQNAWKDGHCRMISTNVPAPLQYNYVTHQMEPSGFDTSFRPSMIDMPTGLDNHFVISNSYLDSYHDYQPTYDDDNQISIAYSNEDIEDYHTNHDVKEHDDYSDDNSEHDYHNDLHADYSIETSYDDSDTDVDITTSFIEEDDDNEGYWNDASFENSQDLTETEY